MSYAMRLAGEAVAVGVVLAAAVQLGGAPRTLWGYFLMGAAIHLSFEAAGLNRTYCRTGAACS